MSGETETMASLDRHYSIHAGLTRSQFREHQERGSCVSCDLVATAERNPRWVAAGRPVYGHTPECLSRVNRSSDQCSCGGRVPLAATLDGGP